MKKVIKRYQLNQDVGKFPKNTMWEYLNSTDKFCCISKEFKFQEYSKEMLEKFMDKPFETFMVGIDPVALEESECYKKFLEKMKELEERQKQTIEECKKRLEVSEKYLEGCPKMLDQWIEKNGEYVND